MANKKEILKLYKKEGETPLECLKRYKADNSQYRDTPMTYAGRLDPMAEGLLLVLAGDIDEAGKKELLGLSKTYEFEVLWGVETDTYDLLGLANGKGGIPVDDQIVEEVRKMAGKRVQKYPPYSSKPVGGKPLFAIARAGDLEKTEIPTKQVEIFSIEVLSNKKITGSELLETIIERINRVKGDFRQEEITKRWNEVLSNKSDSEFLITKTRAKVSSGTYVRSIANELGEILKCGACAYSIKRTQIGDYNI